MDLFNDFFGAHRNGHRGESDASPKSGFAKPKFDPVLDARVLSFSELDHATCRTLNEGTLVVAAAGAGKTTTVGRQFAEGLLRIPNSGGLILTAKAEETANWKAYAKACGREKDLIVFNAESGHCFDPLHYEFTRPGRGAGDVESILDFFETLINIGKKESGQGHDPFWSRGATQIERNVIMLLALANEQISNRLRPADGSNT